LTGTCSFNGRKRADIADGDRANLVAAINNYFTHAVRINFLPQKPIYFDVMESRTPPNADSVADDIEVLLDDRLLLDDMNVLSASIGHEVCHVMFRDINPAYVLMARTFRNWMTYRNLQYFLFLVITISLCLGLSDYSFKFYSIAAFLMTCGFFYSKTAQFIHYEEIMADTFATRVLGAPFMIQYIEKHISPYYYYKHLGPILSPLVKVGIITSPSTHPRPEDRIKAIQKSLKPSVIENIVRYFYEKKVCTKLNPVRN